MFNAWIAFSHIWLAFFSMLATGDSTGKGNIITGCCVTAYFVGITILATIKAWDEAWQP